MTTSSTTQHAPQRKRRHDNDTASRRQAIIALVDGQSIGNQADLSELLTQRGFQVTQATLSRDLKALGIGKIPVAGEQGYTYVLPQQVTFAVSSAPTIRSEHSVVSAATSATAAAEAEATTHVDAAASQATQLFSAQIKAINLVNNLVLLRTPPGSAQEVARFIDKFAWSEVEGSISGDDTVMVITRDAATANQCQQRLADFLATSRS